MNTRSDVRTGQKNRFHTVESSLLLPAPLDNVFSFFAEAGNLETLTPPWLHFEILTPQPVSMGPGTLIDYRLRLHGISLRWQSEITVWDPPYRFVDEQRRGPYRRWIHDHVFLQRDNGTEIRDFVRYRVLGGWLVNRLFVESEVKRIFEYRSRILSTLFNRS